MMPLSTSPTLTHPTLKSILRGTNLNPLPVTQYRNVKYASIPSRWTDSVLLDTLPPPTDGIYDASRHGPSCPQKDGAQAWDLTLIGEHVLPCDEEQGQKEVFDELECLHVSVTVPTSLPKEQRGGKGLPVFVWVHGGGLSMGSNSWPQYDLAKFIARSAEIGKPVIGVSINYRVGILGFLSSSELGIKGNFGYRDQVNGFRWIRRHISGFGGDAANVTAVGESAGGISLSTLLCASKEEALFDRVVIMSGDATCRKPRFPGWHDAMYEEQVKFLGLEGSSKDERVKRLRTMDANEMVSKLPLAQHFCACIDGEFLEGDVRLEELGDGKSRLGKPDWCKEIVVGDTASDGTVLQARIVDNPNAIPTLRNLCSELLISPQSARLLGAYGLDSSPNDSLGKARLLIIASELRFHFPALVLHKGLLDAGKKAWRYHFHVPNPLPGPWTGLSSHELDVAFLLQHYNTVAIFPEWAVEVSKQMADQWITFANGEGWCKDDEVLVFVRKGKDVLKLGQYDEAGRSGRGEVLWSIGPDKCWTLVERLQGVRPDESSVEGGSQAALGPSMKL